MFRYSALEEQGRKRRASNFIDPYPELAEIHDNSLMRYLDRLNLDYLIARKQRTKGLGSQEQVSAYALEVRDKFRKSLGELPDPGPAELRSKVVHTVDKGDYLIDHVFIESLPDYYMPANFYYPKHCTAAVPAILLLCGHSGDGKAPVTYVSFCVEAVANGFCVLVFDPLGQGERSLANHRKDAGAPLLDAVEAHCFVDQQLALTGKQAAQYMMRDNVRAVDYLLSRSEVDTGRIAVTGNSGGGNMSAYMGAYDDRIKAVAPSCYITELNALMYRLMAQDAEQCLDHFMEYGLDHSDLITAAAPKPYLICATLADFFPIDGTRDAYVEAKKMYRWLGKEENLDIYVASQGHGYWSDIRATVLKFFCRHFGMAYQGTEMIDYEGLPAEKELLCAPAGQASPYTRKTMEDIVFSAGESSAASKRNGAPLRREEARDQLVRLLAMNGDAPKSELTGESHRPEAGSGITVRDISFTSDENMNLTGTWYERDGARKEKALLYVGELTKLQPERRLEEYPAVFCVEPRGIGRGSLHPASTFGIFNGEHAACHNAQMLGRTMQGMRVTDVLAGMELLRSMNGGQPIHIALYGAEEHALTALYAAIISRLPHVSLHLEDLLASFRSIVRHNVHNWGPAIFVRGILNDFDVDDLLAVLPQEQVRISGRLDHEKNRV